MKESITNNKSNNSKECIVCHYWFFNDGFKLQDYACNSCHDLVMMCVNISDIANIMVKGVEYCCIFHGISKSEAINLLKISALENCGYI